MCILFISSIKDSGSAGVGPIQSDAELLGILFQGGDTVPQETCRNQRALNRDDPKVAICSIIAIKHSARGEYWYANTHNRPHCKNCTARIDRGGWRGKTIDAINRLDHQPLGPGNGHVGACENEHQVNPENDLQGRSNYTDEYKFLRRSTSNSPRTRYSGTNTAMKSVNSPRRDQSTRHRRSKRPPYSPSTAQAITMKHSKKHISQHEGGRSAPIEIADTPEPQPKSESAPEEEDLSRFIVDDDVDHRETAGYHAQSSDSYSGSSEESLLNDLPADVAIEDDRPIAQNLRPRTGEPTNYKHCYQESIRKNRVFSNGRLLHWDEDGADNEDGERTSSEDGAYVDEEGQDLDSEGDMWGGKVNDNPFTANPGDTEDAYIEPKTAAQGPKRLRRNPRQAKSHAATNLRQKHGTDLRRTARDSRSNNSAGHEPNGDSHLVSGDGLSLGYLEEWSEKTPERPRVSLRGARRADPSSSSNTKRKRTLDAGQRVLRTMLLAHERPSDRHREQVTAAAAQLAPVVMQSPHLQFSFNMAKYDDTQSGLPTPPTSTASASTTLLDSTALPSPRYQGNPDIDDSTNASGTILRLRQQLANLTGQLAMERREHTDLQSACDGMARRCAGLLREVGELKARGERRR